MVNIGKLLVDSRVCASKKSDVFSPSLNKRVIITSNTSWYLYNFRKNTIISIIHEGYDVITIAPIDEYSIKLEKLGAKHFDIYIDQGGTNPLKDLLTFCSFVKLYYFIKPNFILNFTPKNNIYSTLAGVIFGSKSINNIAGLGMLFIEENFTSKLAKLLYKFSQKRAYKVFFQNEDDRKLFKEFDLAPLEIMDRLPGSGVDLSRFKVTPSINNGKICFLLLARMLYDKGIGHYVEAARELTNKYGDKVEFRMMGFLDVNNPSSVSRDDMQSWVDEGVIKYLGTSDNVEKEISKIDCMVLPSFYREGVPKSLLEACAMGKPIITTDSVGCRETVDIGLNGYLCEPRNTASLIEKLELMICHSYDERHKMGLHSRKKVENEFDEKIVISKYIKAIKSA